MAGCKRLALGARAFPTRGKGRIRVGTEAVLRTNEIAETNEIDFSLFLSLLSLSGALSWHLSTCGTKEIDFSLSLSSLHLPHPLASDQGRHGGCRLGWALGPSSLASPAPSLSFILSLIHI